MELIDRLIEGVRGYIESRRAIAREYAELRRAERIVREYEENPIIYNVKHHGSPMHRITTCVPHEVCEAIYTVSVRRAED